MICGSQRKKMEKEKQKAKRKTGRGNISVEEFLQCRGHRGLIMNNNYTP